MGTRSMTTVVDEEGDVYVSLYAQYDGYPDGIGADLAKFLKGAHIGNGIGANPSPGFFNGVGDLAVRLITAFKEDANEIGGLYLYPPNKAMEQEFNYTITGRNPYDRNLEPIGDVTVKVTDGGNGTLFEGTAEEFGVWVDNYQDEDY